MRDYSQPKGGSTLSPKSSHKKSPSAAAAGEINISEEKQPNKNKAPFVLSPALLSPVGSRHSKTSKEPDTKSRPSTILSPALLSPAGNRRSRGGGGASRKKGDSEDDHDPSSNNETITDPQQLLKHAQAQADKFAHLKPSEVRKLLQAEKEKKQQQKLEEQASLLKMQKYRSEINAIRQREQEKASAKDDSIEAAGVNETGGNKMTILPAQNKLADLEGSEHNLDYLGELKGTAVVSEEDSKETHDRTMSQMRMSFAALQKQLNLDDSSHSKNSSSGLPSSAPKPPAAMTGSHRREPLRHLHPDGTGKLQKDASKRSLLMQRQFSSRRGLERTVSNRVPEMRRRASTRDLFDEDKDLAEKSTPIVTKKKAVEGENKTAASTTPQAVRTNTVLKEKVDPELENKKKREEEKQLETQKELEGAKKHFETGYELCWNFQNSSKALEEYRLALLTRETLLGKYHEDTARTYYWIGRSLVKLKEYEESLVAFSRAARIFERVTRKNHKYNIWCATAIDNCFHEMRDEVDDWEAARDQYKQGLENSIRLERAGDTFRKQGKITEAISEYRAAIDQMEDYHPDAADVYQKIAILMRQKGDFEGALEEYRYASEIYEMSLGADHPETVKTLNNLMDKKKMNQMSRMLQEKLEEKEKAPSS
jgi:tetratricopeptide (TPR) repeat protein